MAIAAFLLSGLLAAGSLDAGIVHSQTAPSLRGYADAEATRAFLQAERASARMRAELEEEASIRCMRNLVERGLHRRGSAKGSGDGNAGGDAISGGERIRAISTIQGLEGAIAVSSAYRVLDGKEQSPELIERDPEVRRALFAAMAREPRFGQPKLVELAVLADDPVRQRARDALPEALSPAASQRISELLASDRELHINRAASLASAHPAAELIPALVNAQYAPPRQTVGDEAWIAIGRTSHYIQNQIPVTGDASTSFQPVIGAVFEGSLLRILESKVEIFRTEVHESLAMVVECNTGQPAPPFGYDRDRWLAWHREEFPKLAAAHARDRALEAEAARTRSTPSDRDG